MDAYQIPQLGTDSLEKSEVNMAIVLSPMWFWSTHSIDNDWGNYKKEFSTKFLFIVNSIM